MSIRTKAALALLLGSLAGFAGADDDRVEHYKGEPAETLEQALSNFTEYNARLARILEKESLTAADMNDIHQLTYTLENALGRIDEEVDNLEEVLESVHLASERGEEETVRGDGQSYLSTARKLAE